MNTVQGKNVIVTMKDGSSYYPIFCGKSASFSMEQEELETTSVNSGYDREYTVGMSSASMDVSGVTIIDNSGGRLSIGYLMQQSVRRQIKDFKVTMTGDDATTLIITFQGYIITSGFDRAWGSFSQSNITVRISGGITFGAITPPAPDVLYSDWWVMSAGATSISGTSSVHGYSLTGKTILEVDREGTQYDIITSGTPSGRKCKQSGGSILFDSSIPSNGETVFVLFK